MPAAPTRVRCMVLGIWMAWGVCAQVWGGEAARTLSHNVVVLEGNQGLPHSFVNSLAQTPDGYLWIGTRQGLARYDGTRVVDFDPITNPELEYERIDRLFVDDRGTLWIAPLPRGLVTFRDGAFASAWSGEGPVPRVLRFLGNTSNQWFFVTFEGALLRGTHTDAPAMKWQQWKPFQNQESDFAMDSAGEVLACIRGGARLARLQGDDFVTVEAGGDLAGAGMNCLASDSQGQIWLGTTRGLARYADGDIRLAEAGSSPGQAAVLEMVACRDGSLWVRYPNLLRRLKDGLSQAEVEDWNRPISTPVDRTASFGDGKGGLWVREDQSTEIVHVFPEGQVERLTQQQGLPAGVAMCFLEDSEDGLWIGFSYGGVARLSPRQFHVLGEAEGLTNSAILSVCLDDDGALWMAPFRGRGPVRWSNGELQSYITTSRDLVEAVCPANEGGVWVADSRTGISAVAGGRVYRPFAEAGGLPSSLLHRDAQGRLWMVHRSGVRMWDGGQLTRFSKSLFPYIYRSVGSDALGTLWLGAVQGQVHAFKDGECRTFVANDALGTRPVWSLLAESNGVVWLGTFRGGLMRLKGGKFFRFTQADGLPSDVICSILDDDLGNLWCGSYRGIFRISKQNLHEFAEGGTDHLACTRFGLSDGLPTLECSGSGACPGGWRGPDGRLWFATTRGVVSVQPMEFKLSAQPPTVCLEEVRADGRLLAANLVSAKAEALLLLAGDRSQNGKDKQRLVIRPGQQRYEFRFTGISFDSSETVQFRYRLEGREEQWVEAGHNRTAVYRGLAPGDYEFRVIAANRSSVWTPDGVRLCFTVLPHFYQMRWFWSAGVITALLSVAGVVFLVGRSRMKRELARLELRHAVERERTRIAQDMHDELGASLTKAEKLVELLGRGESPAGAILDRLGVLKETLRGMLLTMDELVWAVNPRNDSLDGLANYIAVYAREFLASTRLRCRLEIPMDAGELALNAQQRHHLFLAFKEALTNVVRHAEATEVAICLQLEDAGLVLQVTDNGIGLIGPQASEVVPGHGRRGLENMRRRLAAVGGRCEILGAAGGGTTVRLSLPVKCPAPHILGSSQTHRGEVE